MGVRGLTTYIFKAASRRLETAGVIYHTTISRYLDDWKRRNAGFKGTPLLVIDTADLIQMLYGNLECVFQGQWKQYAEQVVVFVDGLKSLGVDPVFFVDAWMDKSKIAKTIQRRSQHLQETRELYWALKAGVSPDALERIIPCFTAFIKSTTFLLKFQCGVTVLQTTHRIDAAIADFVNRMPGCVGVVGLNTDYLIHHMKVPVLRPNWRDYKQSDFEISVINQVGLAAEHLGIPPFALPLFACLLGNDVTMYLEGLAKFHDSLRNSRPGGLNVLVTEICQLIRQHTGGHASLHPALISFFGEISMIGSAKLSEGIAVYNEVQQAMDFAVPISPTLQLEVMRSYVQSETLADVLHLLRDGAYYHFACTEDETVTDLQFQSLLKPLRQKIYGVLLAVGSSGSTTVETMKEMFVCCGNTADAFNFEVVKPLLPSEPVVFESLLRPTTDHALKVTTWLEICECGDMAGPDFGAIPSHLIAFVLTLRCLRYFAAGKISDLEWNAFIVQAVVLQELSADYIAKINVKTVIPRAIHLAALFMQTLMMVQLACCVSGQPVALRQTMPWHCFDGKLFHHTYVALQAGKHADTFLQDYGAEAKGLYLNLHRLIFSGKIAPLQEDKVKISVKSEPVEAEQTNDGEAEVRQRSVTVKQEPPDEDDSTPHTTGPIPVEFVSRATGGAENASAAIGAASTPSSNGFLPAEHPIVKFTLPAKRKSRWDVPPTAEAPLAVESNGRSSETLRKRARVGLPAAMIKPDPDAVLIADSNPEENAAGDRRAARKRQLKLEIEALTIEAAQAASKEHPEYTPGQFARSLRKCTLEQLMNVSTTDK